MKKGLKTAKPGFHIDVSDGDDGDASGEVLHSSRRGHAEDDGDFAINWLPHHRKRPSSIVDPMTGRCPCHLQRYGNQA